MSIEAFSSLWIADFHSQLDAHNAVIHRLREVHSPQKARLLKLTGTATGALVIIGRFDGVWGTPQAPFPGLVAETVLVAPSIPLLEAMFQLSAPPLQNSTLLLESSSYSHLAEWIEHLIRRDASLRVVEFKHSRSSAGGFASVTSALPLLAPLMSDLAQDFPLVARSVRWKEYADLPEEYVRFYSF